MIYFTSDNHFCHGNIIGFSQRPFSDVEEMNKVMIDNWNSIVTKKDEIYILGDLFYKAKTHTVNEILSRLKGRKYLIKGNHDNYLTDPLFNQNAFEWVKDYHVLKNEGNEFILFHYPILEWHKKMHGCIHLYGHVHNNWQKDKNCEKYLQILGNNALNVGVDVNNFYPVSIKQILDKVKAAQNGQSSKED